MRLKVYEAVLVAGEDHFSTIDIRVRVKGGGHTSQVYAIRQAIAKALVAYHAKNSDAYSAMELKKKLVAYDRTLLIADPRRMEPKKFGGAGARARRQKRCVVNIYHLDQHSNRNSHTQLPLSGCHFYIPCIHAPTILAVCLGTMKMHVFLMSLNGPEHAALLLAMGYFDYVTLY